MKMKQEVAKTEDLYTRHIVRKVAIILVLLAILAVVKRVKIDVPTWAFNRVSEPESSEDVTDATGAHPRNMRLFLDGMTDSNLVLENSFGIIR